MIIRLLCSGTDMVLIGIIKLLLDKFSKHKNMDAIYISTHLVMVICVICLVNASFGSEKDIDCNIEASDIRRGFFIKMKAQYFITSSIFKLVFNLILSYLK